MDKQTQPPMKSGQQQPSKGGNQSGQQAKPSQNPQRGDQPPSDKSGSVNR